MIFTSVSEEVESSLEGKEIQNAVVAANDSQEFSKCVLSSLLANAIQDIADVGLVCNFVGTNSDWVHPADYAPPPQDDFEYHRVQFIDITAMASML